MIIIGYLGIGKTSENKLVLGDINYTLDNEIDNYILNL